MLRHTPFNYIFSGFCALVFGVAVFCCYLLYNTHSNSTQVAELTKSQSDIAGVIQEITYNAASLSELAQRYVLRGDARYRDAYQQLLDIHNGRAPRPQHYNQSYWDLLEPTRSKRHPAAKSSSISDNILQLAFNAEEKALLDEFEEQARRLQGIEREAIAKAHRVYENSQWELPQARSTDIQAAIELLTGRNYLEARHQAALPLDKLMQSTQQRFDTSTAAIRSEQHHLSLTLPYIIASCLLLLLLGGMLTWLHMRQYHNRLRDISLRDRITGLRNRHYALTFGEKLLAINRRNHHQCAAMLVTVDNFKQVRNQYGYEAGDIVLKTVSKALAKRARKSDIFAYYGGDEFVFVLGGIDSKNCIKFANMICDMVNNLPIELPQVTLQCSARIGFAMSAQNMTLLDLLRRADQALKQARGKQDHPVCAYTPRAKPKRTDLRSVFQNNNKSSAQTQG